MASEEQKLAARIEVMQETLAYYELEVGHLREELSEQRAVSEQIERNAERVAEAMASTENTVRPVLEVTQTLFNAITDHRVQKYPAMVTQTPQTDQLDSVLYDAHHLARSKLESIKGLEMDPVFSFPTEPMKSEP